MFHLRPNRPNRPSIAVFLGFWAGFLGRFFLVATKAARRRGRGMTSPADVTPSPAAERMRHLRERRYRRSEARLSWDLAA